jgi:hypothetical protein
MKERGCEGNKIGCMSLRDGGGGPHNAIKELREVHCCGIDPVNLLL